MQERLRQQGVPTAVYYPLPLHLQPAYAYLGYRAGDFPVAEALCQQVLSLPVHPALGHEQQAYIVAALAQLCLAEA